MKAPKDYLRQPYARIVIPVESNGYHAEILEFPGCYAQGQTPQDAYSNLEKAAESWIDTSLSQGQEIPEPSSNVTYSGHIALRLPRSIHRQAARIAERDDTSLNTFLVSAIASRVGAEDLYCKITERFEKRMLQATYEVCAFANFVAQEQTKSNTIRPVKIQESATTHSRERLLTFSGR